VTGAPEGTNIRLVHKGNNPSLAMDGDFTTYSYVHSTIHVCLPNVYDVESITVYSDLYNAGMSSFS